MPRSAVEESLDAVNPTIRTDNNQVEYHRDSCIQGKTPPNTLLLFMVCSISNHLKLIYIGIVIPYRKLRPISTRGPFHYSAFLLSCPCLHPFLFSNLSFSIFFSSILHARLVAIFTSLILSSSFLPPGLLLPKPWTDRPVVLFFSKLWPPFFFFFAIFLLFTT